MRISNHTHLLKLAAGILLCAASSGKAAVILDNTLAGTNPLTTSLGSITVTNYQAKVFTTPVDGDWALDGFKMALYSSPAVTGRNVFVSLMAVDGSNNPTGAALVSETFVVNLSDTPAYYDFDLNASNWALTNGVTYALLFRSDAPSANTSWTQPPASATYTMSEGFTFVGTRRSTNTGASWSVNSYNNGLQLSAVNSAIPEPSAAGALAGCVALGLVVTRRKRRVTTN
jgi:hypothetical protein